MAQLLSSTWSVNKLARDTYEPLCEPDYPRLFAEAAWPVVVALQKAPSISEAVLLDIPLGQ